MCSVLNSDPPTLGQCMLEWGMTEEEQREREKKQVGGFIKNQVDARKGE